MVLKLQALTVKMSNASHLKTLTYALIENKGKCIVAFLMKISNKSSSFLESTIIFDYVLYDHNTGFDS